MTTLIGELPYRPHLQSNLKNPDADKQLCPQKTFKVSITLQSKIIQSSSFQRGEGDRVYDSLRLGLQFKVVGRYESKMDCTEIMFP
jgi:hypothetical protein